MARTTTPLVGVTPSCHPTAVVEWATRASADDISADVRDILEYWDINASPHEQMLWWEQYTHPPIPSRLSPSRERYLAYLQSEVCRAQWVCSYLAMMSVSPSQPHLHKGGARVR
jgi:hypothetical protein